MTNYSINELEQISGIKAHTIRMWEKRYGLFNPSRCPKNCRVYTESDLDLLKGVIVLRKNGMKISQIAKMPLHQIDHEATCCCEKNTNRKNHQEILTNYVLGFKPTLFSHWIDSCFEEMGVRLAVLQEIFPLQNKIHLLKLTGKISRVQEEMVRRIIIRKLASAIDHEEKRHTPEENFALVFVPQCETNISTSMFIHYILAAKGYQVIDLGQVVSPVEIGKVIDSGINIKLAVTVLAENFCQYSVRDYIEQLSQIAKQTKLLISGYQTKSITECKISNITLKKSLSELSEYIVVMEN